MHGGSKSFKKSHSSSSEASMLSYSFGHSTSHLFVQLRYASSVIAPPILKRSTASSSVALSTLSSRTVSTQWSRETKVVSARWIYRWSRTSKKHSPWLWLLPGPFRWPRRGFARHIHHRQRRHLETVLDKWSASWTKCWWGAETCQGVLVYGRAWWSVSIGMGAWQGYYGGGPWQWEAGLVLG